MKKLLIIILLLCLVLVGCIEESNYQKYKDFNSCKKDGGKYWDGDKQECASYQEGQGCIQINEFSQINVKRLPYNYAEIESKINVVEWCLEGNMPNYNNPDCEIGHYGITVYDNKNLTLCW